MPPSVAVGGKPSGEGGGKPSVEGGGSTCGGGGGARALGGAAPCVRTPAPLATRRRLDEATRETCCTGLRTSSLSIGLASSSLRIATITGVIAAATTVPFFQTWDTMIAAAADDAAASTSVCSERPSPPPSLAPEGIPVEGIKPDQRGRRRPSPTPKGAVGGRSPDGA